MHEPVHEAVKLDMRAGDTQEAAVHRPNSQGKVPTLQRDDGDVVTEYPVIAQLGYAVEEPTRLHAQDRA